MGLLRAATLAIITATAAAPIDGTSLSNAGGDGFMKNYVNIATCEDSNGGRDSYW
jgi:hypothetical protein